MRQAAESLSSTYGQPSGNLLVTCYGENFSTIFSTINTT